jgi:DNA-directed RNA polymerase specialized sigma24 family protein
VRYSDPTPNASTVPAPTAIHRLWGVVRRLSVRIAGLAARGVYRNGRALQDPPESTFHDETVTRFETGRSPETQLALILESLDLLDDADAQVIRDRLTGKLDTSARSNHAIDSRDMRYGLAVIRFSERLAWAADQQSSGVSPPQRRALGLIRFQGLTSQDVAGRLRLPIEVVEYWVREGDVFTATG